MSVQIDEGKYAVVFGPNKKADGSIRFDRIIHYNEGHLDEIQFDENEDVKNEDDVKELVPIFFNSIIGTSRGGGKRTRRKIRKNNKRRKKSSTQKNT